MKMLLKFTLFGIIGLVLLSVVAFYVDYYYYSWTSYANPFGCKCKQITVKTTNILEKKYNLSKIHEEIEADSRYSSKLLLSGSYIKITRIFSNVNYSLQVEQFSNLFKVDFMNGGIIENTSSTEYTSETQTTPDYYIKQNINQMIAEMPLSDEQKEDLKSKVTVRCKNDMKISF
jgi:hypothetical protein